MRSAAATARSGVGKVAITASPMVLITAPASVAMISLSTRKKPGPAILSDTRAAQTGKPVSLDGILPGQEFLDGEAISAACFFERQQAPAHPRPRPGGSSARR